MVKTHEINLITSIFNQLQNTDYIILEDDENNKFETNDYILFKQIEMIEDQTQYTGLHQIVQIKDVTNHQGLKEGFVLLHLNKL